MDDSNKPPSEQRREALAWEAALPSHIRLMWEQVHKAIDVGIFTLVPQGTRTLVDRVARHLIREMGSFAQSIESLEQEGFISRREKARLNVLVEAGHASAHRDLDLNEEQARVLVLIIENLLRCAFFPQDAVDAVKTATPPRTNARKR